MKAIVNTGPGRVEMRELPLPAPGTGQVRIRTGAVGICATDLLMIAGWERTGYPAIPGHEWAGTVDAAGPGVYARLVGARCVAENVLSDGGEVGFEHPGGYAESFVTEARNVCVLPDDFPLAAAALIEPLAVCVRGLSRLGPAAGPALVLGDGPIGLLTSAMLRRRGIADVLLVGGREARLTVARDLGVTRSLNYHALPGGMTAGLQAAAGGAFPVVVEATGSAAGLRTALALAGREGRILVLGDYGDARADFSWNEFLHREWQLLGSNASAGAWPEAVRLAVERALPIERLVSHVLPVERFAEGIALARESREVVKVVLAWEQES